MENIVLNIVGMTCAGCEVRIEKKLKSISGVAKAKANYVDGDVNITYDKSTVNLIPAG